MVFFLFVYLPPFPFLFIHLLLLLHLLSPSYLTV